MRTLRRNLTQFGFALVIGGLQTGALFAAETHLDPAWRVGPVDNSKPGFIWRYFSNNTGGNAANNTDRTERNLAGQTRDPATGELLPNLGDPNAVGAAIGPAAPANPANGLLEFEIAGTINLSKIDADTKGLFTPDELEPGLNGSESTDGQAAEILTYLTLTAGTHVMVVNSDDGFQTASGPNPRDAFGRVPLGEFSGGRGAAVSGTGTVFTVIVDQAGTYPFRTIWENGGGDSNIEWFSVKADGTPVLINDVANGGIPAFRALASTSSVPIVKAVSPGAVPRQLEQTARGVTVVLQDGSNPVDDASVTLKIDGQSPALTKQRSGNLLTVDTGALPGLHLPGESHTGVLTFRDSTGANSRTQQWTFYNIENLLFPATPVTGENFDAYPKATGPENAVPPGWIATNYTYQETAGWDLNEVASDAYLDWALVGTDEAGAIAQVLDNDKSQLVNGAPVTDAWMGGTLLLSPSDGRARRGANNALAAQARIVVSAPFNLSNVTSPVLTFSSGARLSTANWEQMTVEYSVDGGANWLPAMILRNASTIVTKPDGSYDINAMFNTVNTNQIPLWPEPGVGPLGGKFGDMLASPINDAMGPYIANRNDGIAARRVEAIRLAQASRKSDVRLRFTHLGSCGWDWGLDNIAFYDLAPAAPPVASNTINVDFNTTAAASTTYSGTAAAPDTGTTWNGVAIVPGAAGSTFTSGPLVASDGAATPVTVSLSNFLSYNAAERPATLASALFTDFAYQRVLGPGGPNAGFAIKGLDPASSYDLYIYGQNGGYGSTINLFTIDGVTQYTTNAGNIATLVKGTNYVVFSGLTPSAQGMITGVFNVAKVADNAAFNGLQIVKVGAAAPTAPDITRIVIANNSVTVNWIGGGTLESSPSLSNPVWTPTGNSSGVFTEPVATTGNKFYRVRR